MINVFNYLNLPRKSICAFINSNTKEVFLAYSRNGFNFLTDNLKDFRDGVHRFQCMNTVDMNFIILESFDRYKGNVLGKYRISYYIEYYKSQGYHIVNKPKTVSIIPKVIVTVKAAGRGLTATAFCVTERYKRYKVREFKFIDEAEDYIKHTCIDDLLRIATLK